MKTCKTCKWWGEERSWEGGFYPENRATFTDTYLDCNHPKLSVEDFTADETNHLTGVVKKTKAPSDGLHVSDESSVCTGPDFGCVHHEPKAPLT